jgi:hypothetical protein
VVLVLGAIIVGLAVQSLRGDKEDKGSPRPAATAPKKR